MKHNYRIDYSANAIVVTKSFLEQAGIYGTEEYITLQCIREDFPKMKIVTRSVRTGSRKSETKGLTYKYMRKFISTMDSENLLTFEKVILYYENYEDDNAAVYHRVKEWFLENYPYHRDMIVDTAPKRIIKPVLHEENAAAA